MKSNSFERVFGAGNKEQVVIHQKNRRFHLRAKIICLVLAVIFWLVMTNVQSIKQQPMPIGEVLAANEQVACEESCSENI